MKKGNWTVLVLVSLFILFILIWGASMLTGWGYRGWGYGGWGMMGPWMMGGMAVMWLIPAGIIGLLVYGIIWLVRTTGGGANPPARVCPSCGRSVQTDWKNCPNCGTVLKK